MNMPDKSKIQKTSLEPKEGQRRLLSGDKVLNRCPSLDFNPNHELVSDEEAVDYLASILAEIYLALHHEKNDT